MIAKLIALVVVLLGIIVDVAKQLIKMLLLTFFGLATIVLASAVLLVLLIV